MLRVIAALFLGVLLLSGCSGLITVENDVQAYSTLPAMPARASYRFEWLPSQQVDAVLGAFQPLGGPDNANIIPHKTADFRPCLLDHDFFVAIRHPAFIPWLYGWRFG